MYFLKVKRSALKLSSMISFSLEISKRRGKEAGVFWLMNKMKETDAFDYLLAGRKTIDARPRTWTES